MRRLVVVAVAAALGVPAASAAPTTASARCVVPRLIGRPVAVAKGALLRAHCRLGRVRYVRSSRENDGRVMSQSPRTGSRLAAGTKVNVTVGRGRL